MRQSHNRDFFKDNLLSCLFLARTHDGVKIRWGRVFAPFFFGLNPNKKGTETIFCAL